VRRPRRPPGLAAKTVAVTFITVAVILSIVFIVLVVDARDRMRDAETDKLDISSRVFSAFETRRAKDQLATTATLAETPTLKAAFDTYHTEARLGTTSDRRLEAQQTVTRELEKLAAVTSASVLAVLDDSSRVFASAGSARQQWAVNEQVTLTARESTTFQTVAVVPAGAFRVSGAPLRLDDRDIGTLVLGTSLDNAYAEILADLSRAGIVITVNDEVVARTRTVPDNVTRDLVANEGELHETTQLNGEEYAVRTLLSSGPVRIYSLTSIDAAAREATREALRGLGTVALGGFVLAALGSLWLARTLTDPIKRVAGDIATMTAARDFGRTLEVAGTSRELDALATAFNELMSGLTAAEAETQSAYLGAIRALAAALDARDPYTAGHSERVSALSVLIARQLSLSEAEVDIIRLGALLHDIGKIGVADHILRKPGALSADEFEQIRRHPGLGARILRKVPFLEPHLAIVELHHERPDGKGYPFGLLGDNIPLDARIVHVADAFDAMTSARAYRPARAASVALVELQRYSGSQFDPASVDALRDALAQSSSVPERQLEALLGREVSV
jgi:putative nucleotidyltransferase with HDIG domain